MNTFTRGFLPKTDPLSRLSPAFASWEKFATELPKWLMSNALRDEIKQLPHFPVDQLSSDAEMERAMVILSYLGQAFVWADLQHPAEIIPRSIAIPWCQVADYLNRPPILSYASYALNNWRRIDPSGEIELGNIVLLQNFLAGMDEEWFILVHVDIEAKAIPGIQATMPAFAAIQAEKSEILLQQFNIIKQSLQKMVISLKRMPERCDPYIYYNRVRPYIHGWKNNPALPQGIIYQGVEAYQDKPVQFKGETGAQSSIIPMFDAFFGIDHKENPLKIHLTEMQNYMPKDHRQFLSYVNNHNIVRPFMQKHSDFIELKDCYNHCLELINEFRSVHLSYAAHYIQKQHQTSGGNPTDIGTGGTPFMAYLKEHIEETKNHLL